MSNVVNQSTKSGGDTLWARAYRKLKSSRLTLLCIGIVAVYLLIAIGGYLHLVPDFQTKVGDKYLPPSISHPSMWFGTDVFGRSVLYKLIAGAKTAMTIGILAALIMIPLGVLMGAVSGYFGGFVDSTVQWVNAIVMSVPSILLIIAISYNLGRGIVSVCVALGLVGWVGIARLVRGEFIKLREREFVMASRLLGAGHARIIFRHIMPNIMHLAVISASLEIMGAIKMEVILTYLGVGVQDGASWGAMISDAPGELITGVWWSTVGVSVALFLIVFALNRVGDALRDALDPRLV